MRVEYRRKTFHLVIAFVFLACYEVLSYTWFVLVLAFLLVLGALLMLLRPRVVERLLDFFERDHVRHRFPGKGAFMFVGGVLLCALLFPLGVPVALLILGIPDSLATIVGLRFGHRKLPWTTRKSVVGTTTFFVLSSIILFFVTGWWVVGAAILTFFESLDYHDILLLDDNLVLPLASGAIVILSSVL